MKSHNIPIIYIDAKGNRFESDKASLMSHLLPIHSKACSLSHVDKMRQLAIIYKTLDEGIVPVLFDAKMRTIASRVEKLGIVAYDSAHLSEPKLPEDAYTIFFTSGTTGEPTGTIKTKENIYSELEALYTLFKPHNFERIIVTTPLIHIYGFLNGVMLPTLLGCELLIKEEYWPYDLLNLDEGKKSLIVTTPVFIKALLKLKNGANLSHVTFLSSTGMLENSDIAAFEKRFNTQVIQLFGSTETGGIASKHSTKITWKPLSGVKIEVDANGLLGVSSPFISKYLFNSTITKQSNHFSTSDMVEPQADGSFKLLGRLSDIIKVSGKRISITEIENLIESRLHVKEVLIKLKQDSSKLKDETLLIHVVSDKAINGHDIASLLHENYGGVHIAFELVHVESIAKNAMGKKIRQ